MAGIYIHIPFCKRKCHYCDFYKSTDNNLKGSFLLSLLKEIDLRRVLFQEEMISTIYIGGGTPSLMLPSELNLIFEKINEYVNIDGVQEITLEVNPDDYTDSYADQLLTTPVNRLSFGLQSTDDGILRFLNRRHDSGQALRSVRLAESLGYDNITVDLIYGIPGLMMNQWGDVLKQVMDLPVTHVSAYHLTIEEGTVLHHYLKSGKISEVSEDVSLQQYNLLVEELTRAGFDYYEVSNFSRPGFQSVHNSNYWNRVPYYGFGPSSHSFYSQCRYWNVSDVRKYIQSLQKGCFKLEFEPLTGKDIYNEMVMLGLRTKHGVSLKTVAMLGNDYLQFLLSRSKRFVDRGVLVLNEDCIVVSKKNWFIVDGIISELFLA